MDKLKDILNNLFDRISNPLIFSFICSWLIINWQITIALLWYDTEQIKLAGEATIFDFIYSKINTQDSFLHPLYFALIYTIAMPTIKNLIRALHSWTAKWGENWNLRILKEGKIPIEKYFKLRENYDQRTKILEDVIAKENEFANNYDSMDTALLEAKAIENELRQKLTECNIFIEQLNDVKILNGYWTNKYTDTINKRLTGSEEIFIEDGKYYVIEKFGEKIHTFNIRNFHFNNRHKTIFFIKERANQEKTVVISGSVILPRFNPNILKIQREDLIVGQENQTTKIEYKKKAASPTVTNNKNSK